jgi:hypothetical protein
MLSEQQCAIAATGLSTRQRRLILSDAHDEDMRAAFFAAHQSTQHADMVCARFA